MDRRHASRQGFPFGRIVGDHDDPFGFAVGIDRRRFKRAETGFLVPVQRLAFGAARRQHQKRIIDMAVDDIANIEAGNFDRAAAKGIVAIF